MTYEWKKREELSDRWILDFVCPSKDKKEVYHVDIFTFSAMEEKGRQSFSKYHGEVDTHFYISNSFYIFTNQYTLFNANLLEGKFKWGFFPSLKNRSDAPPLDDKLMVTKSSQKWVNTINRFFHSNSFYSLLQEMVTNSNLPEKQKQSLKELTCPKGSLSLCLENTEGGLSALENKLSLIQE